MPNGFSTPQDHFTVTINVAPGVNYKIAHTIDRRANSQETTKAAQAIGVLLLRFFQAPNDPTIRTDLIKARGEEWVETLSECAAEVPQGAAITAIVRDSKGKHITTFAFEELDRSSPHHQVGEVNLTKLIPYA